MKKPAIDVRGLAADPTTWLIVLGLMVRVVALVQFDPRFGYDAYEHFKYSRALFSGEIPRVSTHRFWSAQNPPLFYAVTVLVTSLGARPDTAGQLVSLAAGAGRMLLVDAFMKRKLGLDMKTRAIANAIFVFLPFAIRIDVFYSVESLAATLAIGSVYLAVSKRPVLSGLVLGGALLTKPSAVAAVPAVVIGLILGARGVAKPSLAMRRVLIAGALSAALLLPWAWPNMVKHGTPFPSAYASAKDAGWDKPLLRRHSAGFYALDLGAEARAKPYYFPPMHMPNAFLFEAFGDYYNFLSRGPFQMRPFPITANGRLLGEKNLIAHQILAHVAFVFLALLLVGFSDFCRRVVAKKVSAAELSLVMLALACLAVALIFGIAVPNESHGAVKSTYALAATPALCLWTARVLVPLTKRRIGVAFVALLLSVLPLVAMYQRLVF